MIYNIDYTNRKGYTYIYIYIYIYMISKTPAASTASPLATLGRKMSWRLSWQILADFRQARDALKWWQDGRIAM